MPEVALSIMQQIPFKAIPQAPRKDGAAGATPSVSAALRVVGRALAVLATLAKTDPATAHHVRRALLRDAGAPLSAAERKRIGGVFRSSLFQRQQLDFWWIASERHITSRLSIEGAQPRRRLPDGSIFIGSYCDPHPEKDFLADLDALLADIRGGMAA